MAFIIDLVVQAHEAFSFYRRSAFLNEQIGARIHLSIDHYRQHGTDCALITRTVGQKKVCIGAIEVQFLLQWRQQSREVPQENISGIRTTAG